MRQTTRLTIRFVLVLSAAGAALASFNAGCKGEPARTPDLRSDTRLEAAAAGAQTFAQLLPAGRYQAEVLDAKLPARQEELARRMLDAQLADPAWFQAYVADFVKRGGTGPLPYHERLGISRAEYEELQRPDKIELQVVGSFPLEIRNDGGTIRFRSGATQYRYLDHLAIDPRQGTLTTAIAKVGEPEQFTSQLRQFGQWNGVKWHHESGDLQKLTGQSITFWIGSVPSTGHVVVDYSLNVIDNGSPVRREVVLFRFQPTK